MTSPGPRTVPPILTDTLHAALGRNHRDDPTAPSTGGPAGNARLTAWTGLILLGLSIAELVTLLNVGALISWHIVIGALLIPPAILKTASTGWRVVQYYRGDANYQSAGPPPMLLRILGPGVVAATLGLLASGALLIIVGRRSTHTVLITITGQRLDWLTLHQGFFVVWAGLTGLHVLARTVPAVQLTVMTKHGTTTVDGMRLRTAVLLGSLAVAAVAAVLVSRGVRFLARRRASWSASPARPAGCVRQALRQRPSSERLDEQRGG